MDRIVERQRLRPNRAPGQAFPLPKAEVTIYSGHCSTDYAEGFRVE